MESVSSRTAKIVTTLAITACLVGMPAAALAQAGGNAPARAVGGLGYGFVGLGAVTSSGESMGTWHVGGGGEAVIRDAIGIGAEIGYLNGLEEPDESGLGVFSLNGSYHFNGGEASRRFRPFLTAGYTLGFAADGHENLFNIGGGVDYWLKPKVGLRVEFRDHVWSGDEDTLHFWSVRFGVTFR